MDKICVDVLFIQDRKYNRFTNIKDLNYKEAVLPAKIDVIINYSSLFSREHLKKTRILSWTFR